MDYSDSDDPKDECSTPKKKRAMRNELSKEECHREYRKKQFQLQWLSDEKYKLWLREVKSESTKCKCIVMLKSCVAKARLRNMQTVLNIQRMLG